MASNSGDNSRVRTVEPEEDFLNTDSPIRGQEFVCLSFLSPEKVLEKKELFFFQRFMKFYEAKIRYEMLEKFLAEFATRQNTAMDLSIKYAADYVADEVTQDSQNEADEESAEDASGNQPTKERISELIQEKMSGARIVLADVFDAFRGYVETHRSEVSSKHNIEEAYKDFMFNKEQELEDEFHAANDFRTTVRGVKIRGSYSTHKEACVRAKKLQKEDPAHDVFVGQVGYWLPWDPHPHNIENQEYAEKELNELMKKHKEKQEMQKELFEAEKTRKVEAARADAAAGSATTSGGASAAASASATSSDVTSDQNVRTIQEARDIMAEMEANRIPVNPSQMNEAVRKQRESSAPDEDTNEGTA